MLTPPMPNVAGMTDTLDFVKNLWGNMNVPGVNMAAPSLSTDELDKKIADLKAVETWLNLNTTMLRATIQSMEVQRNTIATLKSMGESMAQAMRQPGADDKAGAPQAGASPFAAFFTAPAPSAPAAAGAPKQAPKQAPEAAPAPPGMPPAAAAMPAAVAWWNLLQDQFTQAVASAISPEAIAGAAAMAQDAAARSGMPAADAPKPGANPPAADAAKARAAKPKADKS